MCVVELLSLPQLPPGRKIVTCCIPGCSEREIAEEHEARRICWKHCTTHSFPRDTQTPLDFHPEPEEAAA